MTPLPSNDRILNETVISGGYCVGCGACALADERRFRIELGLHGELRATSTGETSLPSESTDLLSICPHSGVGSNESDIASLLFGHLPHDDEVGHFEDLHVLALSSDGDRQAGSSGGGVTWLLRELLKRDMIDAIGHVQSVDPEVSNNKMHFEYSLSRTLDEVNRGRKSVYYPVSLDKILDEIRITPGRYAVVAVPCFAKAIRRLMLQDPVLNDRIRFGVGLVCGHLKTRYYGEYLAWMDALSPSNLRAVDFRKKLPGLGASSYAISASTAEATKVSLPLEYYFGTSWDYGFMKYRACDYCDDVFAETADIVFGDAWIPPYDKDWLGHNIVVTRNKALSGIILDEQSREDISVSPISLEEVRSTQAAGLRHRREGTRHRLARLDKEGLWRPQKRVEPMLADSEAARYVFDMRTLLARRSKSAFRVAKSLRMLWVFHLLMAWPVASYNLRRHGISRAVRESVPFKALRRWRLLIRRNNRDFPHHKGHL